MSVAWNFGPNILIKHFDRNRITYHFTYEEDCNRIMEAGLWAIKCATLNLSYWNPQLTLDELYLSHYSFWVQVHNLPLNRRNMKIAVKLGNLIG